MSFIVQMDIDPKPSVNKAQDLFSGTDVLCYANAKSVDWSQ